MEYEDFEKIMLKYPSGFVKKLKVHIPGKKGEDYWPIKLQTKKFIANIPLNQETAQFMNSCKYGFIEVNYCIGYDGNVFYWNDYVIDEQKVPVYIVDGYKKWVVMIKKDNRSYEVSSCRNK
jgi:hypothetical protein